MIAAVLEVTAAAAARGSSVRRSGSMSAKTGRAPAIMIAERRIGRGERRGDDLVAWADTQRAQSDRERIGAGADADGVRRAARVGELLLERLQLGSEHEPAARDHALDGRLVAAEILRRRQLQEGDQRFPSPRLIDGRGHDPALS